MHCLPQHALGVQKNKRGVHHFFIYIALISSLIKLNIPFFRSATGQRSFSYRAAQLWNDLPEILTNIVSFNVFKNAIKRRALDEFLSHC